ncbi:MAG: hypothetical protein WAZ94_15115 [Phycisphaerales bacterium]|nr:hypothetical protein [Chloroflexota bacterium]
MDLSIFVLAALAIGIATLAIREAIGLRRERSDDQQKMLDRAFRRAKRLDLSGPNDRR